MCSKGWAHVHSLSIPFSQELRLARFSVPWGSSQPSQMPNLAGRQPRCDCKHLPGEWLQENRSVALTETQTCLQQGGLARVHLGKEGAGLRHPQDRGRAAEWPRARVRLCTAFVPLPAQRSWGGRVAGAPLPPPPSREERLTLFPPSQPQLLPELSGGPGDSRVSQVRGILDIVSSNTMSWP